MMGLLFLILIVLVIHSFFLEGAKEGLSFYLIPNFKTALENYSLGEILFAALGQSFFTLSLGIGALAIFGSYIDKEHSLVSESLNVVILDTTVAFFSGLVIFPACFTYNVDAGSGPSLIFVTLPQTFSEMAGGRVWGSLFFVFLAFASLTTIIAVFENIIAFAIDFGWTRKKAVIVNIIAIIILSLPCALGFNLWSGFQPFGPGTTVQDLEDFILSNTLLPLGSLLYLLFCTNRYAWNWDNYYTEVNSGKGLKLPKWTKGYLTYILPLIIIFILIQGFIEKLGFPANYLLPLLCLIYPLYLIIQARMVKKKG